MPASRLRTAAAVLAFAVLASACGGGSGRRQGAPSTGAPAPGTTTSSVPTSPAPITSAPPTTSTPTTAPTHRTSPTTSAPQQRSGPGAALAVRVLRDGLDRRWVHVTIVATLRAGVLSHEHFEDISGPSGGHQQIHVGSQHGMVVLIGRHVYVRGGAASLVELFEIPPKQALSLARRWISLVPSDPEFASIAAGITLRAVLTAALPTGDVTVRRTSFDGRPALELTGRVPAAAQFGRGTLSLLVTAGAHPLPLEVLGHSTVGSERETFTAFGAALTLAAPPGAAPLPSSSGPGGVVAVSTVRPEA